jgi:hypothetical protein
MFDPVAAARTAVVEAGMARVFTTRPGDARKIGLNGRLGIATNDTPCIVPGAVGLELITTMKGEEILFRVEFEKGEKEAAMEVIALEEAAAEAAEKKEAQAEKRAAAAEAKEESDAKKPKRGKE